MQSGSTARTENPPSAPEASSQVVVRNAVKAFELIEKHRALPDPKTYSVWYAFVAGTDRALVDRVDHILSTKEKLPPEDVDTIYEEMIISRPSETAQRDIGEAMEKEIKDVLQIVQQSVRSSHDFQTSLNAIGATMPAELTGEELNVVFNKLVAENRRMAAKTLELRKGLSESQRQISSLNTELEEIQRQHMRDPLTSIANRRAFDKRLSEQIELAKRGGPGFCLALADIDKFKNINDTHGHQAGDQVLKSFAHLVSQNIKGQDMVARIGGEEFAIILPQTDVVAAHNLLIKIKHSLKSSYILIGERGEKVTGVTASFGIALFESGMTTTDLIGAADSYLYEAKNTGRDRVKAKGL
jgi:diguanylate cyclase